MSQELNNSETGSINNSGTMGVVVTEGGRAWIEKIIFSIAFPFNQQQRRFAQFVTVTIYISLILAGFKRLLELGYADSLTYLFWLSGNIFLALTGIYYTVFWNPHPPKLTRVREYTEFKIDTTKEDYEDKSREAFKAIERDKKQGEKELKTFGRKIILLRFLAVIGMISVLLFTILGYQIWKYFDVDSKTILATANYAASESIQPNSSKPDTQVIHRELELSTKAQKDDERDIKLKAINNSFLQTQRKDVISEGNKRNASVTIWGWYNQSNIFSYFELLKSPPNFPNLKNDKCIDANVLCLIHDQSIAEVNMKSQDKLEILKKPNNMISSEMSYLTLFTLGLTHYKEGLKTKENFEIAIKSLDRAIDRFTKALDKLKDFKEPKSNLEASFAQFYLGNAHFYKALFSKSGVLYDSAIQDYTKVIELNSEYISHHNSWENSYSSGNGYRVVSVSYTSDSRSIELSETRPWQEKICASRKRDSHVLIDDSPSQVRAYLARAYNNRGVAYAMKSDIDKALSDYENALRLDSEIDEVCVSLGLAYSEKGNYTPAIKNYEQAISVDSQDKVAYNNLGNVYAIQGNYEEAISQYDKATRIDPNFAEAYYNRGQAYSSWKQDKNKERSEDDFRRTIELRPNFAELYYYGIGKAYFARKDYDQAVKSFTKATELKPDFAEAFYIMGRSQLARGAALEAIQNFNEAIELKPEFSNEIKPEIATAYREIQESERIQKKAAEDLIKRNQELQQQLDSYSTVIFSNTSGRDIKVLLRSVDSGSQVQEFTVGVSTPTSIRLRPGNYKYRVEVSNSFDATRAFEDEFSLNPNENKPIDITIKTGY